MRQEANIVGTAVSVVALANLGACQPPSPAPHGAESVVTAPAATAKAAPVLPPLPEGYDWSLSLGDDFELDSAQVTEISADERDITRAYFAACEKKLGALPLETFDCSDAQPMPVTGAENLGASWPRSEGVSLPGSLTEIARCDRPSLIYRDLRNVGCSSGSRIRRVSTATTDWSYVCRKGHSFFADANLYSEIGLIGNNRSTGETCFFAGRSAVNLSISQRKGGQVRAELDALTGQRMHAPSSEAGIVNWSVPREPGCTACHSQGPG